MNCRHCGATLEKTFLDLGFAPPSNSYLTQADLLKPEKYYPLKVKVCEECWLVQTEDYALAEELFNSDYSYFSSTSSSWLSHARDYCERMIPLFKLDSDSHVVEVASNDGYLLRNFVNENIPCLGIEPTSSTAAVAEAQGIKVLREFFSETIAHELKIRGASADLIIANNVYAHVPNINDFTRGLAVLLKPEGVITLEFPHLLQLIRQVQFDTIYHEHFSYLSLGVVKRIFAVAGLRIWDVEELPTHGGSLRVYGCLSESSHKTTESVTRVLEQEKTFGLEAIHIYSAFQARVDHLKYDLLTFLIEHKRAGRDVVAYGAAAKGNTLLNYVGVSSDLLCYVCDAAVAKQGKYLPGSHIPIMPPQILLNKRPDVVIILPWNLKDEVVALLHQLIVSGTSVYVAVPKMECIA